MFTIFVTICSIFFTDVLFAENRNCFSQTLMDPWVMHFHILKNCPLVHNLRTINSYQLQPLFCLFPTRNVTFCATLLELLHFLLRFVMLPEKISPLLCHTPLCCANVIQLLQFFYIGLCKNNNCLFDDNCFAFKLDWALVWLVGKSFCDSLGWKGNVMSFCDSLLILSSLSFSHTHTYLSRSLSEMITRTHACTHTLFLSLPLFHIHSVSPVSCFHHII